MASTENETAAISAGSGSHDAERRRIHETFRRAAFVNHLGIELADLGPGWAESTLAVDARHAQAEGIVHGGVQATMADHTAGAAAITLLPPDKVVLTLEFKVNLLQPARGERLRCRAKVVKPGRSYVVVLAEVYCGPAGQDVLASISTVTMVVVPDPRLAGA